MTQENENDSNKLVDVIKYILDTADRLQASLKDAVEHVQDSKKDIDLLCSSLHNVADVIQEMLDHISDLNTEDAAAVLQGLRQVIDLVDSDLFAGFDPKVVFKCELYLHLIRYLLDNNALSDWEAPKGFEENVIAAKNILLGIASIMHTLSHDIDTVVLVRAMLLMAWFPILLRILEGLQKLYDNIAGFDIDPSTPKTIKSINDTTLLLLPMLSTVETLYKKFDRRFIGFTSRLDGAIEVLKGVIKLMEYIEKNGPDVKFKVVANSFGANIESLSNALSRIPDLDLGTDTLILPLIKFQMWLMKGLLDDMQIIQAALLALAVKASLVTAFAPGFILMINSMANMLDAIVRLSDSMPKKMKFLFVFNSLKVIAKMFKYMNEMVNTIKSAMDNLPDVRDSAKYFIKTQAFKVIAREIVALQDILTDDVVSYLMMMALGSVFVKGARATREVLAALMMINTKPDGNAWKTDEYMDAISGIFIMYVLMASFSKTTKIVLKNAIWFFLIGKFKKKIERGLWDVKDLLDTIMLIGDDFYSSRQIAITASTGYLLASDTARSLRVLQDAIKQLAKNIIWMKIVSWLKNPIIKSLQIVKEIVDEIIKTGEDFNKEGNKRLKTALKGYIIVEGILITMITIIAAWTASLPIFLAFTVISPLIIVSLVAFGLVMVALSGVLWVIHFLISKVATPKTIISLLVLNAIAVLLVGIAAAFALVGLASAVVMHTIGYILGFLLFLIAFMGLFAVLGLAFAVAQPLLLMSTIMVATMAIAVGCILAIAVMLMLIGMVELDREAIKENVKSILDTAKMISAWVWEPMDETGEEAKDDKGLSGFFGSPMQELIGALFAAPILASSVFSVLAILLMAGMLRLLQEMDLDEGGIQQQVSVVINTCRSIIKMLFAPDEENKDSSERSCMKSILEFLENSAISRILDAIFAAGYLAVMVISIGAILMIAGMLRLLQEINLDYDTILDNVSEVIGTCRSIIKSIFAPDEENKDSSDRGIMKTLMDWAANNEVVVLLEAIFSMAYLAVMFIAVLALLGVAKVLTYLADLNPEVFSKARENVSILMNLMSYLRSLVFAPDKDQTTPSNRGALMSIIAWVAGEGVAKTLEGILMIGYLATMYLCAFLLVGLAKSVGYLADINPKNISKAQENAKSVMTAAIGVMNELINGDYDLPQSKDGGVLRKLASVFLPDDLMAVADALATVGKLAAMQISVGAVARLAKEIQTLANIHFGKNVTKNVTEVITTSKKITNKLLKDFGEVDAKELANAGRVIKQVNGQISQTISLANTLNKLAGVKTEQFATAERTAKDTFKRVRMICGSIISEATYKTTWTDITDRQDEYVSISNVLKSYVRQSLVDASYAMDEVRQLAKNITKISSVSDAQISAASNITQKSVDSVHNLISHGLMTNRAEDTLEVLNQRKMEVAQLGEMVTHGSDALSQLNDMINTHFQNSNLNEDIITAKATAYKTSLNEFRQILEMADSMEPDANRVNTNADLMDRIAKTIGHFVKVTDSDVSNSRRITENYGKFLATVDKMDYQKLNATAWMMKHWASISRDLRGDFEGLARSVNENVMPMLDKLNKTMAEVTKCQQEIINDLTQPVSLYFPGSEMPTNSLPDFNTTTPAPNSTTPVGGGDTPDGSTSAAGNKTSTPKASTPFSLPHPQYNGPFATQTTTRPRSTKLNSLVPELGKKYTVEFSKIEEA